EGRHSMKQFVMMKTGVRLPALTLLALTRSWHTAQARDLCITGAFSGQYVGKSFKLPSPGKCEPFLGFFTGILNASASTGQACTAADGSHVDFGLTTTFSGVPGFVEWDNIELSLPALTGTLDATIASGGRVVVRVSAAGPRPPTPRTLLSAR